MIISANLQVRNLEQAWLNTIREIMEHGREYRKDDSSRAGLLRKSLDYLSIEITHPEERPLVPLSKPGCISTCNEDDAWNYFQNYLLRTELAANEHYTYGQYLSPALEYTCRRYTDFGLFSQKCTMQVGLPSDLLS